MVKEKSRNRSQVPPLPSSLPSSAPKPGTSADPLQVGQRIGELRGRESQGAFADAIGVHVNTLGRYERGERLPDAEFLSALAARRDISTHWLLYGIPPRNLSDARHAAFLEHSARLRGEMEVRE